MEGALLFVEAVHGKLMFPLCCRMAGRDMVGALGAEVDRLETEIQQIMPGIRHIDLVSFQRD